MFGRSFPRCVRPPSTGDRNNFFLLSKLYTPSAQFVSCDACGNEIYRTLKLNERNDIKKSLGIPVANTQKTGEAVQRALIISTFG